MGDQNQTAIKQQLREQKQGNKTKANNTEMKHSIGMHLKISWGLHTGGK